MCPDFAGAGRRADWRHRTRCGPMLSRSVLGTGLLPTWKSGGTVKLLMRAAGERKQTGRASAIRLEARQHRRHGAGLRDGSGRRCPAPFNVPRSRACRFRQVNHLEDLITGFRTRLWRHPGTPPGAAGRRWPAGRIQRAGGPRPPFARRASTSRCCKRRSRPGTCGTAPTMASGLTESAGPGYRRDPANSMAHLARRAAALAGWTFLALPRGQTATRWIAFWRRAWRRGRKLLPPDRLSSGSRPDRRVEPGRPGTTIGLIRASLIACRPRRTRLIKSCRAASARLNRTPSSRSRMSRW